MATAARKTAQPGASTESRRPRHPPHTPGRTKISRRRAESPCPGQSERQCRQGAQHAIMLAHRVPREIEPTTNPAIHAQQITSKSLEAQSQSRRACADSPKRLLKSPLAATELPIRNRHAGNASPTLAAHGRHPAHKASCRRAARPITSFNPCQSPRSVSSRSPSTTSRSRGVSNAAAAALHNQPALHLCSTLLWIFIWPHVASGRAGFRPTRFRG